MKDIFLWKQREVLTIQEAAWLLTGETLPFEEHEKYLELPREALPSGYIAYKDHLIHAIYTGELIPSDYYSFSLPDGREIADAKLTEVCVEKLAIWYKSRSPSGPWPAILQDVLSDNPPPIRQKPRANEVSSNPETTQIDLIFRKEKAGLWLIKIDGREERIRHYKGMEYIKLLFASPRQPLHVLKLTDLIERNTSASQDVCLARVELDSLTLTSESDYPILDEQARKSIEDQIKEYKLSIDRAIRDNASYAEIEKIEKNIKKLEDFKLKSTTPTGKPKKFEDPVDKARKRVHKSISDATNKLRKLKWSALDNHLNKIKTGVLCCYQPLDDINWIID